MGGLIMNALSSPRFKCPLTFGFLNTRYFTALFRRSGSSFNLVATIPTLFFATSRVSATLSRCTPPSFSLSLYLSDHRADLSDMQSFLWRGRYWADQKKKHKDAQELEQRYVLPRSLSVASSI
jgi:hypothetical protein